MVSHFINCSLVAIVLKSAPPKNAIMTDVTLVYGGYDPVEHDCSILSSRSSKIQTEIKRSDSVDLAFRQRSIEKRFKYNYLLMVS